MKRSMILLAGALVVATATQLSAQQIRLGIKGGPTFADLYGDDVDDTDMLTSFAGGIFAAFELTELFAIQPEAMYTGHGAGMTVQGVDTELQIFYVQVPLLARMLFLEGPVQPMVYAGPRIAFQTSCEVEAEDQNVTVTLDCDDPQLDAAVKDTELGVVGGAGVAFNMGDFRLLLEGRGDLGLTSIDDVDDADVKNRSLSALIGFSIPLGGGRAAAASR